MLSGAALAFVVAGFGAHWQSSSSRYQRLRRLR